MSDINSPQSSPPHPSYPASRPPDQQKNVGLIPKFDRCLGIDFSLIGAFKSLQRISESEQVGGVGEGQDQEQEYWLVVVVVD